MTGHVGADQAPEEIQIGVFVEHRRVVDSLVGEENAERKKNRRTEPDSFPHEDASVTRHLIARVVYNVIENEKYDRYDKRHTYSTLADYGSERRAYEEEYYAGEGEGEFFLQLYVVAPDGFQLLFHHE